MICKKAFYVFPLEIVEIVCPPKRGGGGSPKPYVSVQGGRGSNPW